MDSFGKKDWGISYDQKYTALRSRLLNIFLIVFTIISVFLIIYILIFFPLSTKLDPEIQDIYISTCFMLLCIAVVFILKRWISVDAASILFLLFLVVTVVISDVPEQVAEGRTLIFFTLPIMISSVLYRPWASFVMAGISSFAVSFLDIVYLHTFPNFLAWIAFLILALTAWLFASARDNANLSLYRSLEKIKLADEEIKNLAKFPNENPNAVMRISFDGKLIYANSASQQILDHWQCKVGDLIPEEFQNVVQKCLTDRCQCEHDINIGDNVYSIIFASIPESNYVNLYGRDETERVRGEIALRESEQRYRQLFDTMLDGFALHEIICDEAGKPINYRFLEVNPAFEKLTGLVEKDIIGKTVYQVMPDVEPEWIEIYGNVALTGESARFENYSRSLDKYFEVVAFSPCKNQFAALFADVTERKKAEAALKNSMARERKLAEILENASQPFATGYPDGRMGNFNAAFCNLLGYSQEEFQRVSWLDDITPPDWHQIEKDQLALLNENEQSVRYEKELLRKNGTRVPVELLVHLMKDEKGNPDYYYAFITDLTERKKAEQEVRLLNLELEERVAIRTEQLNNTLSELESFAYSVSHDLRTPLRAIDGFSQALESEYYRNLEGEGLHYLERIRAGVKRMDNLITDLLKLSRVTRQEFNLEMVDLTKIAYGIRDELQNSQPDRVVQWDIQEGLKVYGDTNLLKVAVGNLLQNAWKFTGTREIASIQFGCFQENGEKVFYVRDNGVGFDMNYADKLFGAFQRLHSINDFPGSGIGLATVKRIIHRHGGRVWADASLDHGAVFYFSLENKNI
ncbi:MAG: PAS domain S-box protein [Chloroflexi bacterium]|nr:PAS domain S-box protein [Chloroflexota bacterium]